VFHQPFATFKLSYYNCQRELLLTHHASRLKRPGPNALIARLIDSSPI
jgi:hypothetical protein